MVELKVLGPIQAYVGGDPVDLGGPTQRRLLASLIARSGEIVPMTSLLEHLWGEDPPPSGPQSIQSYISRLRKSLGADVIETKAPGYRLNGDLVEVDSLKFMSFVSNVGDDPGERLKAIDDALSLWAGPPFEGFEHLDFAARSLIETRFGLVEERARLVAHQGQIAESVAALEKIISDEPLRESAWLALSNVLAEAGRQAEAVRALDRYRDQLAEIGLQPGSGFSAAMDELFEMPSGGTVAPLPRVETSFFGRRRELEAMRGHLANHRLVTISGPGGMGKSRLAIQVLGDLEGPNVCVVRLAGLGSDREVAPAVLSALGGESRGDPGDAVIAWLSRNPALLLMDNAEHVIEAVANLASRIITRTEARMLVTSREPLSVLGEVVVSLEPLESGSAVDLYLDRARQVFPGFEASRATLQTICEQLDNMPLAIEMAAARSKALSPEEILSRLDRRFGLLRRPLRGGTGRHRSLDSLVDWSYGLLEEGEKRVFERLSVLSGMFDVETACEIAGHGSVRPDEVPGILAGLVEKSLVSKAPEDRYRVLRLLKSFAREKLVESGDAVSSRTAHSSFFARVANRIGTGLSTPEETIWIERANEAVEDLGEALQWSIDNDDLDTAEQILEGLFDWFYHRQPPAIIDWGDLALAKAADHSLLAVAGAWASLAAMKRGDLGSAETLARNSTTVEGDASRFAWFMVGEVACYLDRLDEALDAYRRQRVRASRLHDRIGVVDAMAGETLALAFQGMFDRATDVAVDLEKIAGEVGAPTYRAYARYALGESILDSDPERAARLLGDAAALASSVNNQYIEALAQTTLGSALARLERFDEAIANLHRALEAWEVLGMPSYHWAAIQFLGAILAQTGQPEPASRILGAAAAAGRRPFAAGQRHWRPTVAALEALEEYEGWAAAGSQLDIAAASELAVSATRPRR